MGTGEIGVWLIESPTMVTQWPQRYSLQKVDKDSGRYEGDCNPSSKDTLGPQLRCRMVPTCISVSLLDLSDDDDDPWSNSVVTCRMWVGVIERWFLIWPTRKWYSGVTGVLAVVKNSLEAIDLRRIQVLQTDLIFNLPMKPTWGTSSNPRAGPFSWAADIIETTHATTRWYHQLKRGKRKKKSMKIMSSGALPGLCTIVTCILTEEFSGFPFDFPSRSCMCVCVFIFFHILVAHDSTFVPMLSSVHAS